MVCYFCFNDTATTEIYTYCHTHSLHDALPIASNIIGCATATASILTPSWLIFSNLPRASGRAVAARSEEHTSELQSLMRTTYAVFCLKKKRISASDDNTSRTTPLLLGFSCDSNAIIQSLHNDSNCEHVS